MPPRQKSKLEEKLAQAQREKESADAAAAAADDASQGADVNENDGDGDGEGGNTEETEKERKKREKAEKKARKAEKEAKKAAKEAKKAAKADAASGQDDSAEDATKEKDGEDAADDEEFYGAPDEAVWNDKSAAILEAEKRALSGDTDAIPTHDKDGKKLSKKERKKLLKKKEAEERELQYEKALVAQSAAGAQVGGIECRRFCASVKDPYISARQRISVRFVCFRLLINPPTTPTPKIKIVYLSSRALNQP